MPNSTVDEEHLLYSLPLLCQYDDDYTFHFQRVTCTTNYLIYGWQLTHRENYRDDKDQLDVICFISLRLTLDLFHPQ
jgi:hypothetical protein